jgi:hypothetical protein
VGVEHVMDYILQRIGGLQQVYLVGELANGQSAKSIDLVIVGEQLNKKFLSEQAAKAEKKINKKIRIAIVTPEEFAKNMPMNTGGQPLLLWSS